MRLLATIACLLLLAGCSPATPVSRDEACASASPTPTSSRRELSEAEATQNKAGLSALATAATAAPGLTISLVRSLDQRWLVTRLSGGVTQRVQLDRDGTTVLETTRGGVDGASARVAEQLRVQIDAAIATAQTAVTGALLSAEAHSRDGSAVWEVTIDNGSCRCSGNPEVVVLVDATNGQRIH